MHGHAGRGCPAGRRIPDRAFRQGLPAGRGLLRPGSGCMDAAGAYASNLGLAFQIRDDMLDVIGDAAAFGKPIGSDASNEKSTYVSILGLEECERRVLDYTEKAKAALKAVTWPGGTAFLCALADAMTRREK